MTHIVHSLPAVGQPLAGGFYAGQFRIGDELFALVVAPKLDGEVAKQWNGTLDAVTGAGSYNDGAANTAAMAQAGSELGKWAAELSINSYTDWYIPSRDELELMYRNLKPTARANYCSFRDGDNPSSIPLGYPYTDALPAQCAASAFQEGGAEAFAPEWYWTSTQYEADSDFAWTQYFLSGGQGDYRKYDAYRARAVRRFKI